MIVVTGGSGFIGSAIVWGLNKKGIYNIHIVDWLRDEDKWKNLLNLKFIDYEEKDPFLKRILFDDKILREKVEAIIHMGACSVTTENDVSFLIENNFKYTQVLAKWCIRNNKKFIYASSAATYGDGTNGFDDAHEKIENLKPLNKYGFSKHIFDLWALRNGLLDKITGIKFFNVYGPNEYHKEDMRSVVHKAFEQINTTGKLKLFKSYKKEYKDGGQLRDFIYIKDAVDMTLFIFEKDLKGIYNIGTGKARSFEDLGKAVFKAMNKKENIEYIDMPDELKEKYQYFTEARMDKLKSAGYPWAITSLEDGIDDYVKNYLLKSDKYLK
ncbi:MAG: ADP-glyceromanno-heptose 6-epimerase [Candidatus Goldbacteria bacterium]|nr:ADP-glyceromanno-heptose 6-epimerase [Candidatus Goldiibacteriota bacterium]